MGTGTLSMAAGTTLSWLSGTNYAVGNPITLSGDPNFAPPAGTTQTLTGVISDGSSPGVLNMLGPGTLVLTGTNSYTGGTSVNAGSLYVNGNQSAATGATTVASGATLGGTGTIGGNVNVMDGGALAPGGAGGSIGTLTINGNLGLSSGSILNYNFGQPNVVGGPFNDLTVVNGNLTLAGTLNVNLTPGGAFGPGLYRIFSYNGTLTDNGLGLGTRGVTAARSPSSHSTRIRPPSVSTTTGPEPAALPLVDHPLGALRKALDPCSSHRVCTDSAILPTLNPTFENSL